MNVKAGNRSAVLTTVVSFIIIVAAGARGLIEHSERLIPLSLLLTAFLVIMSFENVFTRNLRILGTIYLLVHVSLMAGFFLTAPIGDYWAILLLPSCIFAMRYYSKRAGFVWIGLFTAAMLAMLTFGHTVSEQIRYGALYFAAYLLVASYSLTLKDAENARKKSNLLLEELQTANIQLREYAENVGELASIAERNRLARDLHDSVTQTIFSMTLITRSALLLHEKNSPEIGEKLENLQSLAQNALDEMRTLIEQLRPLPAGKKGLNRLLKGHFTELRKRYDLRVTYSCEPDELPLKEESQQELFRIIQEGLNNVVKHAGTQEASVHIADTDEDMVIEIEDTGRGFDPEKSEVMEKHFGLKTMKERADVLGGTIHVESSPGEGTMLRLRIPLSKPGEGNG